MHKLWLWWNGYCTKHLCQKVMVELSIGLMCPECLCAKKQCARLSKSDVIKRSRIERFQRDIERAQERESRG
jgi:hypothetical protein